MSMPPMESPVSKSDKDLLDHLGAELRDPVVAGIFTLGATAIAGSIGYALLGMLRHGDYWAAFFSGVGFAYALALILFHKDHHA